MRSGLDGSEAEGDGTALTHCVILLRLFFYDYFFTVIPLRLFIERSNPSIILVGKL